MGRAGCPAFRPRWTASAGLCAGLLALASACGDGPSVSTGEPVISLDFEGSSLGSVVPSGTDSLDLRLRTDTNADRLGWFAFRVDDGRGRRLTFRLVNAGEAGRTRFWTIKQPVASSDGGRTWRRITDTSVEDSVFVFRHTPASSSELVALALPYPFSRWTDYVAGLSANPRVVDVQVIGSSLGGEPLHMLEITDPSVAAAEKEGVWVVGRQHPGEPEGSYMVEGFMSWALGDSPDAARLRRRARVFVVGFMNPDGVLAGNQRVNLAGLDLNRQWDAPDPATAPTVAALQDRIAGFVSGGGRVRILVDFHSAPGAVANFFFYNEVETSTPELFHEIRAVLAEAHRANPDFVETDISIARTVPTGERARNWAFHALGTHGLTVEATSNFVDYGPRAGQYVTESRLLELGRAVGESLARVLFP